MVERVNGKPWWESNLEWTLSATLQDTFRAGQRLLRGIPDTISAHHLEQPSHVDNIEPDPVEKISRKPPSRLPRIIPPPPKPACLERKRTGPPLPPVKPAEPVQPLRAINAPVPGPAPDKSKQPLEDITAKMKAPQLERKVTLEQLLDPDFCGYTS